MSAAPEVQAPARSGLVAWMDRVLYPGHGDHWDDALFRRAIEARLTPRSVVLELGAGTGRVRQMDFRGRAARVVGVDPDPRVAHNPHLDEAHVATGEALPFPDAHFDLVFCDNVLEHLERPGPVFDEVRRVLVPGGVFLAKTPNRRHYVALAARLTPHRFHAWVNRRRGRAEADTFPTRYRANTPGALRGLAAASGFRVQEIRLVEGRPEYLRGSALGYLVGWLYERLVNHLPGLARFRVLLIAVLARPEREAS